MSGRADEVRVLLTDPDDASSLLVVCPDILAARDLVGAVVFSDGSVSAQLLPNDTAPFSQRMVTRLRAGAGLTGLLADDKPLPEAVVRPCAECPWLRSSRAGHLGPATAQEWVEMAHGETPIACHMTTQRDEDWANPKIRQCAGAGIYRANVCKKPRDPDVALGQPDRTLVFGQAREFIEHHEPTTPQEPVEVPCGMQWHYGTLGPINHSDPDPEGPQGWSGIHGAPTREPSGICQDCQADWRENYPRHALPRPLVLSDDGQRVVIEDESSVGGEVPNE